MSTQEMPSPLQSVSAAEIRQRLAGLIDTHAAKSEWYRNEASELAIKFCSALPMIFGEELDRMKMWDKIPNAIESAYAKTVSGDFDLFFQCVVDSLQAEASKVVTCQPLIEVIDAVELMTEQERQDWLTYIATHRIIVCVRARRVHKSRIGEST